MAKGHVTNPALKRLNTRDLFGQAAYLREKDVPIEGIGIFRIRELDAAQRLLYLEYLEIDDKGKPQFGQAKQVGFNKFIVSMGVIGDSGLMFHDIADMPEIRFDVAEKLTEEILELSGLRKKPEVPAKAPNAPEKPKPPFLMP
jgi:hypothetical protein